MIILYVLNLLLAGLLTVWPYWFSRFQLRLGPVNPIMIMMLTAFPIELMKIVGGPVFLIERGLLDPGYQFAVLMTNVQLSCQWIGAILFLALLRQLRITRRWRDYARELRTRPLGPLSWVCLFLAVASWALLAANEFGIAAWIANPREGYQLHRGGAGHWYAFAISFLGIAMLFAYMAKPRPLAVLIRMPLFIAASYFLGSKGVTLMLFTTSLVFLAFLQWRHLPQVIGFGMPLIFVLLSFNLFLAIGDALSLQSLFEYFDYYKNAAMYYNDYLNGQTKYFFGEISWTSYAAYVPRALWPDKPVIYGILLLNDIYYPGATEMTNTPAFGAAVEYFADFGVPAVALSGLLSTTSMVTAFAGHILFNNDRANVRRPTLPVIAAFVMLFMPTFGMFFPGALYAILLGLLLLGCSAFVVRQRRSRGPESRAGADTLPAHAGG